MVDGEQLWISSWGYPPTWLAEHQKHESCRTALEAHGEILSNGAFPMHVYGLHHYSEVDVDEKESHEWT